MSAIITTLNGFIIGAGLNVNDEDMQSIDFRKSAPKGSDPSGYLTDVDQVWPRSRMLGADYANIAPAWDNASGYWEWPVAGMGHRHPKVITGVTKDSSGNPLGGVTVQLFNSATGALVDTAISDSVGNYRLGDPNNVNSFVVAYEAGSPDVAGTTKNNLTGT